MAVSLSPVGKMQFLGANGSPLAGGFVFTYAAGTSTPQATYTDSTGSTPNANPIVLDSGGFANIWLTNNLAYKFQVQNSASVVQWTTDNIIAAVFGGVSPQKQIFTSGGTFTIPTGITQIKVTVIGGGGAGGGSNGANAGVGGGSGGVSIKWLSGLTPGNTLTVTVGGGGAGASGANGNPGVASSVSSGTQTITTITANGGGGGTANQTFAGTGGGAGALPGTGDINIPGWQAAQLISSGAGGQGASSLFGLGGTAGAGGSNGGLASGNGAGGGGAQGATFTGGAGSGGLVIFEWVA